MIIAIFVIAPQTNQLLKFLNIATILIKENAKRLVMMIPAIMQSANVITDGLETNVKFLVRIMKSSFKNINWHYI